MKRQFSEQEKKISEISLGRMRMDLEMMEYTEKELEFNLKERFPTEMKLATKKLHDLRVNVLPNARRQVEILEDQIKNGVEEIEKKEV